MSSSDCSSDDERERSSSSGGRTPIPAPRTRRPYGYGAGGGKKGGSTSGGAAAATGGGARRYGAPEGYTELIEPLMRDFDERMREAEAAPHGGRKKHEMVWPIIRLNHERSRAVYDLFYRQKKISRECFNYCLRQKVVDAGLIAKWKKQGFERLCCLQCISARNHTFQTACLCRVPKKEFIDTEAGGEPAAAASAVGAVDGHVGADARATTLQCLHCGCRGCASGD